MQFFEDDQSYLCKPFEAESLYSCCARTHRLNAHITACRTSHLLFNDSIAGLRHDFPINLEIFCNHTNHLFGTIEEIIYERTAFGIFAPFLRSNTIESIVHNMRIGGPNQVKYHLGILPSRVGTAVPLKACPNCIKLDISVAGVAWWHIEHQWPTNAICPKHGDYLLVANQTFHSKTLKDWYLPSELSSSDWYPSVVNDEIQMKLSMLSRWSNPIVHYRYKPFDGELLRLTYHLRAKALGWTAMDGSLKFKQIKSSFLDAHKLLEELPGFTFIKEISEVHGGFLNMLFHQFKGNKHPLKHTLLLNFLFNNPEQFITEYERVQFLSKSLSREELWSELTSERNKLQLLVTESGYSASAAAKALTLPVGPAIRFLRTEGVEYGRCPRVLYPQKEVQLKKLLRSGEERESISSLLNIKKSYIKDYLAQHPKLRDQWIAAHHKRTIKKYRENFLSLLMKHPDLTVKLLKLFKGNGIQWLCRHDRIWIEQQLPSLWRTK